MHNNYYFLRQLSKELDGQLRGFTVVSCFSQNKEELVLEFNNSRTSFFIRASLLSNFCCLSFPEHFIRARKNSVDLFHDVVLKKVEGVRQYENERSFSITLESNWHLLFKMQGNRANVILLHDDKPIGIFRNHLKGDWQIRLRALDRTIDWSRNFFETHQDSLTKVYITFGKEVWAYMKEAGFEKAGMESRWKILQETLRLLKAPEYLICEKTGKLVFSLVPFGETVARFSNPVKAINEFYHLATHAGVFTREKDVALRQLKTRVENGGAYIQKNHEKLNEILNDSHYQAWADLIMANLGKIKTGMEKIALDDFYNDNTRVEIKLKKSLSAQKNAEVYYRKAKNQKIEILKLRESIAIKEKEIDSVNKKIAAIENETELRSLHQRITEAGLTKGPKEKQPEPLPYIAHEFNGFKIWVGKNAVNNDVLTLKHSYKDDLWLHAKDVAGSHVLVKYQAGKNFPKDVIEHAARLAAYHSKRKNESLCPVIVTPKKFVRKRKGDPAGAVVVEREKVIMVSPLQR